MLGFLKMTTKEAVLEMIRKLPEDVTLEDILAELYFRRKVDRGLRELDEGKRIAHEQVRERLRRWLA
jgi:predicted transcriptional regulator